ncbi:hypothetical protein PsorP6_011006 [Peronosclerospora sorghi]|uniref:Uncharacterized protein n=1 Tax=Peronosclerospora sorghi TaxID=230839 RepID=A0ACC0VWN5_9STRA|nr:hypothetical protein PsorP6_011006 [Peronosclerospora sorghi]
MSGAVRNDVVCRDPLSECPTTARGTVTLPASSHIVTNAVGYDGNRRRLRAVAHWTSVPSVTPQRFHSTYLGDEKKVLGRYCSHDCVILCKTILSQLKSQTLAPTILNEAKSPASIRWKQVAKEMGTTQSLQMTPIECQVLWRFLAYGQLPKLEAGEDLESDSDSDELEQSPKQIIARLAAERAKVSEKKEEELRGTNGERHKMLLLEKLIESKDKEEEDALGEQRHDMDTSIKLCPTYELPTGTPDDWYRPFGPRDALPLALVTSRLLRRKPTPTPVPPSQNGISTALPGASATGLPESKRKQTEGSSTADVAKKLKLVTPPASTSLLPATPSPVRARARSDLDFFDLCLHEDHNKTTPGTKFEISTAYLQRQFLEASPEIRRRCQVLALEDSERFHRNSAPERIWQKATKADTMNSNFNIEIGGGSVRGCGRRQSC